MYNVVYRTICMFAERNINVFFNSNISSKPPGLEMLSHRGRPRITMAFGDHQSIEAKMVPMKPPVEALAYAICSVKQLLSGQ